MIRTAQNLAEGVMITSFCASRQGTLAPQRVGSTWQQQWRHSRLTGRRRCSSATRRPCRCRSAVAPTVGKTLHCSARSPVASRCSLAVARVCLRSYCCAIQSCVSHPVCARACCIDAMTGIRRVGAHGLGRASDVQVCDPHRHVHRRQLPHSPCRLRLRLLGNRAGDREIPSVTRVQTRLILYLAGPLWRTDSRTGPGPCGSTRGGQQPRPVEPENHQPKQTQRAPASLQRPAERPFPMRSAISPIGQSIPQAPLASVSAS
jgi:hypothetical protein